MPEDFVVTPWEVTGEVDYDELMRRFGTQAVDDALMARIKKHTGDLHPLLERGLFFSHRDMNWILDEYEKGNKFALYTGRGPSSGIHIGHMVPWIFTRWLQEKFRVPLWFQITDDEKFWFRDFEKLEESNKIAYDNILDLIAIGFDPKLTKIFIDTEYIRHLYPLAAQIAKRVTFSTAKAVFGFDESFNIGQIFYTALQSVPCFLPSVDAGKNVPVLIPCGIDQDPHFRVTRDLAERLGYYKPAGLYNKLMPGLLGLQSKMSTSRPETAIFATDTEKAMRKKIANAFTGGRASVEEQRRLGANPDICSVFAYYTYLFAPKDDYLADVERTCRSGERLCGDCKKELADHVAKFLATHQERREKARDRIEEFVIRD
ncbi:MAG: tryptophan--tRNA ligase [Methanobacteriota archaeon]|nr:MAG: tryptophan--tRNA ligase [Euryarchaeota archaeon]